MAAWASTGLRGLDNVLNDLRKGDNIVWQVDRVEDYQQFVAPYVARAKQDGRKLIYMRFADHAPLLKPDSHVTVYNLDAESGFETFSTQVHSIIGKEGKEVYYVFDCLSDLLSAWATDLMIGNFFMITCPYLFELDTIAYFALLRDHSPHSRDDPAPARPLQLRQQFLHTSAEGMEALLTNNVSSAPQAGR